MFNLNCVCEGVEGGEGGRGGSGALEVWRASSLKGLKFGGGRSVEGAPRQKKGCGRKRKDECVRVRQLGADCGEDGR